MQSGYGRERKGETVIQADKISIDSKTGNLIAQGSVLSMMARAGYEPDDKAARRRRGRPDRRSRWCMKTRCGRSRTGTKARLVGAQGDLTGRDDRPHARRKRPGRRAARGDAGRHAQGVGSRHDRRPSDVRGLGRGVQHGRQGQARSHASHDSRRMSQERGQRADVLQGHRQPSHRRQRRDTDADRHAIRPASPRNAEWPRSGRRT